MALGVPKNKREKCVHGGRQKQTPEHKRNSGKRSCHVWAPSKVLFTEGRGLGIQYGGEQQPPTPRCYSIPWFEKLAGLSKKYNLGDMRKGLCFRCSPLGDRRVYTARNDYTTSEKKGDFTVS